MTLRVLTPADPADLVDLALLKMQLEIDATGRDALLAIHLAAAVTDLESATQRRFLAQDLEWSIAAWPVDIALPVAPVAADGVTAVLYVDAAGEDQALAADQYVVAPCGPTVTLRPALGATWPALDPDAAEPVRIQFTAGEPAEDIAPSVKLAAMMLTALLFADRGDGEGPAPERAASGLPRQVENLIADQRW